MSIIPILTAAKVLKALSKAGFVVVRQIGSHAQLRHSDTKALVTVARHTRDLSRKTLQSILKQAGLSTDEFLKLLK